ncbi:uncharacterized protein C10orf88 homolog [Arapaima gigas]
MLCFGQASPRQTVWGPSTRESQPDSVSRYPKSPERQITHVIRSVPLNTTSDLTQLNSEIWDGMDPVYLGQGEETSPCLLRLEPVPDCAALITSVLIISEARTMEVYSGAGEYLGTCRGETNPGLYFGRVTEERPFYKKHLKFESPATSCEVKLLSLGGRARVGIGRIALGLQISDVAVHLPSPGPGIDLHQVQSLVDAMGATLSPGAQSLMDMVKFQQKNKMDVLAGFLPLLMSGGPLPCLARGAVASQSGASTENHPESPQPDTEQASRRMTQNMVSTVRPESGYSPPPHPMAPSATDSNDHKLNGILASLLNGHLGGNSCDLEPDMFPGLQKVCGQVAELCIENSGSESKASPGQQQEHRCCCVLEEVMERRMEEMERRLTRHIDQRLEALQKNLQRTLLDALPHNVRGALHSDPHCGPALLNGEL